LFFRRISFAATWFFRSGTAFFLRSAAAFRFGLLTSFAATSLLRSAAGFFLFAALSFGVFRCRRTWN
jgi:hypothetical protein